MAYLCQYDATSVRKEIKRSGTYKEKVFCYTHPRDLNTFILNRQIYLNYDSLLSVYWLGVSAAV